MKKKFSHRVLIYIFATLTQPVVFITLAGPALLNLSWIQFSNSNEVLSRYGLYLDENKCPDPLILKECNALFTQAVRDMEVQYYTLILAIFFYLYGGIKPWLSYVIEHGKENFLNALHEAPNATHCSGVLTIVAAISFSFVMLQGGLLTADTLETYMRESVYSHKIFIFPPMSKISIFRLILIFLGALSVFVNVKLKEPRDFKAK